jgi:hypothetical protein
MNDSNTFEDLLRDPSLYAEAFELLHAKSHNFCCESELKCKPAVAIAVTIKNYQAVIGEILAADPNPEDVGYTLRFINVPSDEFNEEPYLDISLYDAGRDATYSTAFQDWGSLKEMRVEIGELPVSRAQILAELLWDCTFWGYSQQNVWDERDKLKSAVDDVSAGNCISFDSMEDFERAVDLDSLK